MSDSEKEALRKENVELREELRKCKIRNLNLTYVKPSSGDVAYPEKPIEFSDMKRMGGDSAAILKPKEEKPTEPIASETPPAESTTEL